MIPAIGTVQRDQDESYALARASEILREKDGRVTDALYQLVLDLAALHAEPGKAGYATQLAAHVEQCWATRILR